MDLQSLPQEAQEEILNSVKGKSQLEITKMAVMWHLVSVLPILRLAANESLPEGFEPDKKSPLRARTSDGSLGKLYDLFKAKTRLDLILAEANALSEINPLNMPSVPKSKKGKKSGDYGTPSAVEGGYIVPSLRKEPCSGLYVTALMVGGLFVKMGENEELCGPLFDFWPLKDALALSPTPSEAL